MCESNYTLFAENAGCNELKQVPDELKCPSNVLEKRILLMQGADSAVGTKLYGYGTKFHLCKLQE